MGGKHSKKKEPLNIRELIAEMIVALASGIILMLIEKFFL